MTNGATTRRLLLSIVTLALADCGPAGAPIASVSSSHTAVTHHRMQSWMLPGAKREELLYVSDAYSKVYVYSYPKGKLVGILSGFGVPEGECVDAAGDVWVTEYSSNEVAEYAHGGVRPISTLTGPGGPYGCSVDSLNGNLAVAGDELDVFVGASGSPATFSDPDFPSYFSCTYDNAGDLFADDYGSTPGIIAELPNGSSQLETVTLSEDLRTDGMQWDGANVAIEGSILDARERHGPRRTKAQPGPLQVYRVSVSGSSGTIVGKTLLKTPADKDHFLPAQLWISGGSIIGIDSYRHPRYRAVLSWRYPKGGMPTNVIRPTSGWNTVLSPAPRK